MKKMSVLMVMFVVLGCGKIINPTGPSEAIAADMAKSSSETGVGMPVLGLSPTQTTVRVGDEVVVEAVVENAVDLYGVAATVLFDNDKLSFVKIEEGGFLKQQNPTSIMSAIRSKEPCKLVIGLSSLGKVNGVSGNGTLFRITFKALSPGQSELKFVDTALRSFVPSDTAALQKIDFESRPLIVVVE